MSKAILKAEAKITSSYQISIPIFIRRVLGVGAGDKIKFYVLHGEVRIVPVRQAISLAGMLEYDGDPIDLERMHEAVDTGVTETI